LSYKTVNTRLSYLHCKNKKDMKKALLIISLISFAIFSFAGEKENSKKTAMKAVSFKVVDSNNESIAGAEIVIKNLDIASYSDMNGNYTINVPVDSNEEVKISFISFKDEKLNINSIKDGKVVLIEE